MNQAVQVNDVSDVKVVLPPEAEWDYFDIVQTYTARETFNVRAPDAATALTWMTEGGKNADGSEDGNYPGDRRDDSYLDVIGHRVYDAGTDACVLDTMPSTAPELMSFVGKVADVCHADGGMSLEVEVSDNRPDGVFARLLSWNEEAGDHPELTAFIAQHLGKRVRITITLEDEDADFSA
jgi:hypothetical protein